MKLAALILAILTLTPASSPAQSSPLIGIFEAASAGRADGLGKPGVRVLFYLSGRQWRSYDANCTDEACLKTITHLFPPVTTWTLIQTPVQSGRSLAKVTAITPTAFHFYSEIGVQAISHPGSVSNLEPRPRSGVQEDPHTILATTFPTLTDPDNWQPSGLLPLDLNRVRQDFHKAFPHPNNCAADGKTFPKYRPWTYTEADVKLKASYLSNQGWRLAQLNLDGYHCDGIPDQAFLDQWFAISPTGDIVHLGALMHFAGAADFAHDGRSELLFSNQGANNNGYKLFYDNFSHHAQAVVTSH
jgi:hypothetical protein